MSGSIAVHRAIAACECPEILAAVQSHIIAVELFTALGYVALALLAWAYLRFCGLMTWLLIGAVTVMAIVHALAAYDAWTAPEPAVFSHVYESECGINPCGFINKLEGHN